MILQDLIFYQLKIVDELLSNSNNTSMLFYITDEEFASPRQKISTFRPRMCSLFDQLTYFNISQNDITTHKKNLDSNTAFENRLITFIKTFQRSVFLKKNENEYNKLVFDIANRAIKNQERFGQYFTPIPIVDAIINLIKPRKDELICDPSPGIGDFLSFTYHYVNKNNGDTCECYLFQHNSTLIDYIYLNLFLNYVEERHIHLYSKDINKEKLLVNDEFFDPSGDVSSSFDISSWDHFSDSNRSIKKYDVVVSNPPFGKANKIKISELNNAKDFYEVLSTDTDVDTIDISLLHIENAVKLLKEGGRFALIISNSVASNDEYIRVRKWLIDKIRIVALLDLPPEIFYDSGVPTTLVIGYKKKKSEIIPQDYEIFSREIVNIGYKLKTEKRTTVQVPSYKYDHEYKIIEDTEGNPTLLNDLPEIIRDFNDWIESKVSNEEYLKIFKS